MHAKQNNKTFIAGIHFSEFHIFSVCFAVNEIYSFKMENEKKWCALNSNDLHGIYLLYALCRGGSNAFIYLIYKWLMIHDLTQCEVYVISVVVEPVGWEPIFFCWRFEGAIIPYQGSVEFDTNKLIVFWVFNHHIDLIFTSSDYNSKLLYYDAVVVI